MAIPATGSSVLVKPGEKALAFSKPFASSSNEQIHSSLGGVSGMCVVFLSLQG